MRRIVLFVLLAIVQLQLAWGAAAAYCTHESAAAASHFGHHEHRHAAEAKPDGETGSQGTLNAGLDADCQSCHFGGLLAPPHGSPSSQPIALLNAPEDPDARFRSFIPSGPERPDRQAPALA